MADFFKSPQDLTGWIKSKPSSDKAAESLVDVINTYNSIETETTDSNSIHEGCKQVFEGGDEKTVSDAATILYGILAKHNLATMTKNAKTSKTVISKVVEAQSSLSRQRNEWVKGNRNKWNRVVDGFNEGTPWRIDRDKFYNFTHYYTDAISFDEDPAHVYSGEALWRMYIMDKFTREHLNKEGKWVGGYINDRFYVFPDAGTPANPDVPRDGGNPMGLPLGARSRLPRPHQWSTERRLDEARKTKTNDLVATASTDVSFSRITKFASVNAKKEDVESDKVTKIIYDAMDMIEAGVDYEKRINLLSEHYASSITNTAEIEKFAQNLMKKHCGIGYSFAQVAKPNVIPSKPNDNNNNNNNNDNNENDDDIEADADALGLTNDNTPKKKRVENLSFSVDDINKK